MSSLLALLRVSRLRTILAYNFSYSDLPLSTLRSNDSMNTGSIHRLIWVLFRNISLYSMNTGFTHYYLYDSGWYQCLSPSTRGEEDGKPCLPDSMCPQLSPFRLGDCGSVTTRSVKSATVVNSTMSLADWRWRELCMAASCDFDNPVSDINTSARGVRK